IHLRRICAALLASIPCSCLLVHYFASVSSLVIPPPPRSTLFPYTTLFRSREAALPAAAPGGTGSRTPGGRARRDGNPATGTGRRSEEHTSELQSRFDIVCRLLLETKKELRLQD